VRAGEARPATGEDMKLFEDAVQQGMVQVTKLKLEGGAEYIGETVNMKPHGLGTLMYSRNPPDAQGRIEYAGAFFAGQRQGYGSMLWRDGTNYMGQWNHNRPTGFGFESYPNGSFYQVPPRRRRSAPFRGHACWPMGTCRGAVTVVSRQGTFNNDQRDGIGVYEFPNGLYYAGGWRMGRSVTPYLRDTT
jgi:hypothetical protein